MSAVRSKMGMRFTEMERLRYEGRSEDLSSGLSVPRAKGQNDEMIVLSETVQPMRAGPSGSAGRAGLKSPLAALVKSQRGERRRKRPGASGQMSDREMNASEPRMKGRKGQAEVGIEAMA